jgi:hypothetical protein
MSCIMSPRMHLILAALLLLFLPGAAAPVTRQAVVRSSLFATCWARRPYMWRAASSIETAAGLGNNQAIDRLFGQVVSRSMTRITVRAPTVDRYSSSERLPVRNAVNTQRILTRHRHSGETCRSFTARERPSGANPTNESAANRSAVPLFRSSVGVPSVRFYPLARSVGITRPCRP